VSGSASAGLPRAVLDSNVIFSRVLHELMGRVAGTARLLDLVWSDDLLTEAKRVLQEKKPMPEAAAERWVSLMRDGFPEGQVDPSELPVGVDLSALTKDAGDEFVCALAIVGGAQYLFTFDRGYLTEALRAHDIIVTSPDPWLVAAIAEQPDVFEELCQRKLGPGVDDRLTNSLMPSDGLEPAYSRRRRASSFVLSQGRRSQPRL
jgi:predicted nucleic acid-binding protein